MRKLINGKSMIKQIIYDNEEVNCEARETTLGCGVKQRTGWVQSTDALLAFDNNQDGIINDGSELFGNNTLNQIQLKVA